MFKIGVIDLKHKCIKCVLIQLTNEFDLVLIIVFFICFKVVFKINITIKIIIFYVYFYYFNISNLL